MKDRLNFVSISIVLVALMFVFSWYYVFNIDDANLFELFSKENLNYSKEFLYGLLGRGAESPAFEDIEEWKNIFYLSVETVAMSVLAIAMATIGMLATVLIGARNISDGSLISNVGWYFKPLYYITRFIYIFSRAVPELIWAMIIILAFRPGIIPGAIALAIHNFGILGKLCSEVVENIDSSPIKNLYSSGLSNSQVLMYGIFPMVLPGFMTYIVYRWEVIIRTTIIVGFVGAGGLGRQFRLSMSAFNYSQITIILIAYLALVFIADGISKLTRYLAN